MTSPASAKAEEPPNTSLQSSIKMQTPIHKASRDIQSACMIISANVGLLSLPTELLRKINSNLTSIWDRASLLLVCKHFITVLGTDTWERIKATWRQCEGSHCSGQTWDYGIVDSDDRDGPGSTQWRQLGQFIERRGSELHELNLSPEDWLLMYDDEVIRLKGAKRIARFCAKRREFLQRYCRGIWERHPGLYFSYSENRLCSARREKLAAKAHLRFPWKEAYPWQNGRDHSAIDQKRSGAQAHVCDSCYRLGPMRDAQHLLQLWKPYQSSIYGLHAEQIQLVLLRARYGPQFGISVRSLAHRGFFDAEDPKTKQYSTSFFSVDARILRSPPRERGGEGTAEVILRVQDITMFSAGNHRTPWLFGGGTDGECGLGKHSYKDPDRMAELWCKAMNEMMGDNNDVEDTDDEPAQRQTCYACGTVYKAEFSIDFETNSTYEIETRWLNLGSGDPLHSSWRRHFHTCHFRLDEGSATRKEREGVDLEKVFESIGENSQAADGILNVAALTRKNMETYRVEMERRRHVRMMKGKQREPRTYGIPPPWYEGQPFPNYPAAYLPIR